MFGPVDIEVHRLQNPSIPLHTGPPASSIYILDTARLFPAGYPPMSPRLQQKNPHLTQLLRPELIRKLPLPLSSDSFSKFGSLDGIKFN